MGPRALWLLLAVLAVALTVTVVPGVFTVDENHYLLSVLALQNGRLTVPGTDDLPATSELLWFDPAGPYRIVESTPVAPTVPPLYALLALPFSWAGWRGLVALNTLGFVVAILATFVYARHYAERPRTAWLAAGTLALGGYCIEYAQGLWPQMVTMGLAAVAVLCAARARDDASSIWALAAGLAGGLAAGVRYQNVFFAGCVGLGLFLWTPKRWRVSVAYGLGLAVPLGASSVLNRLRLGFWNPVSKGSGYLSVETMVPEQGFLRDALTMAWARVVDYSARPPLLGTEHMSYLRPDPVTGAYLLGPAMKKAWLQSAPWIGLALIGFFVVWVLARSPAGGGREVRRRRLREVRALALVVLPTLAMFSATGVLRTDGFGFNQRYFLELLPLTAVAFAWWLDDVELPRVGFLAGALGAAVLVLGALSWPPDAVTRQRLLLYAPLGIAGLLILAWIFRRAGSRPGILAFAVGAALTWGLCVHLGEDLATSRAMRQISATRADALADALPSRAALFAFWGNKDAVGPLLFDHDLVVADVRNDQGAGAMELKEAFFEQDRPVFILATGFPPGGLEVLAAGHPVRWARREPPAVLQLLPRREVLSSREP